MLGYLERAAPRGHEAALKDLPAGILLDNSGRLLA